MKKYIVTLVVFTTLLGCSDSSDSGVVLPKKITEHFQDNDLIHHYTYDGNKLISVTETDNSQQEYSNKVFSYEADKLIRINNMLTGEYDEFHYNSDGVLSEIIYYYPAANAGRKCVYNFTSTGFTIGFYQGDLANQNVFLATEIFTTDGGNVVTYDNGNFIYQLSNDYKNNPFKNISNFLVIQCWFYIHPSNFFGGIYLNQNNVLSNSDGTYVTTRTYNYNSADYPRSFYSDDFETELKTITY